MRTMDCPWQRGRNAPLAVFLLLGLARRPIVKQLICMSAVLHAVVGRLPAGDGPSPEARDAPGASNGETRRPASVMSSDRTRRRRCRRTAGNQAERVVPGHAVRGPAACALPEVWCLTLTGPIYLSRPLVRTHRLPESAVRPLIAPDRAGHLGREHVELLNRGPKECLLITSCIALCLLCPASSTWATGFPHVHRSPIPAPRGEDVHKDSCL